MDPRVSRFSVAIQAWDFRPGHNFVLEMQRALENAKKIIMVLSEAYLESQFTAPEWAGFFARDPASKERKLIPVRIAECQPEGLLRSVVYVDLVGLNENQAKSALLGALSPRSKPESVAFPSSSAVFPGRVQNLNTKSLRQRSRTSHEVAIEPDPLSQARSRLKLMKQLNSLRVEQFNMLVFALSPPNGLVSPMPTPQEQRCEQLLTWAEAEHDGGCGLTVVHKVLHDIRDRLAKSSDTSKPEYGRGELDPLGPSQRVGQLNREHCSPAIESIRLIPLARSQNG